MSRRLAPEDMIPFSHLPVDFDIPLRRVLREQGCRDLKQARQPKYRLTHAATPAGSVGRAPETFAGTLKLLLGRADLPSDETTINGGVRVIAGVSPANQAANRT